MLDPERAHESESSRFAILNLEATEIFGYFRNDIVGNALLIEAAS